MLRYILLIILFVLIYSMLRRVLRSFFEGLGPTNENSRTEENKSPKEVYRDVKDADFEDLEKR